MSDEMTFDVPTQGIGMHFTLRLSSRKIETNFRFSHELIIHFPHLIDGAKIQGIQTTHGKDEREEKLQYSKRK